MDEQTTTGTSQSHALNAPPRAPAPVPERLSARRCALALGLLLSVFLFGGIVMLAPAPPWVEAAGPTNVTSGTISQSVTWTLSGSPYIVGGNVAVGSNVTLTIEPGVEVRLSTGAALQVNAGATLIAEGTATQPITLTSGAASPAAGDWPGLQVSGKARLAYCDIRYAGSLGSLEIASSDVQMRDCRVRDGKKHGIYLYQAGIQPVLQNVTVTNHAEAAVYQTTINMNPVYRNLRLSGNGTDAVVVITGSSGEGALAQDVTLDGSRAALNGSPIIITGTVGYPVRLMSGRALTITPGTEVRVQSGLDFGIFEGGRLFAEGTATQPITLTSAEPNPTAGTFLIRVYGGGSLRLSYCDLRYGGRFSPGGAIELLPANATVDVAVRNCRIRDGLWAGIYLWSIPEPRPMIENVTITGHPGPAIWQVAGTVAIYRNLTLSGNGTDAIVLSGGSLSGAQHWSFGQAGAPVQIASSLDVPSGSVLSLEPGTSLRFITATALTVSGSLYALGTPTSPVTLTGWTSRPGAWRGIQVTSRGTAVLQNCNLAYGGGSGAALLDIASGSASVQNCRIHESAGDGISVASGQPVIRANQIVSNAVGVTRTAGLTPEIDARNNWWGDPSGPSGSPDNPSGRGDRVGPGIRFDPWLRSPTTTTASPDRVVLDVVGPGSVSPGQSVDYVVLYSNQLSRTIENAVLVLTVPLDAEFRRATAGGIHWPERQQVFWRLGDLAPGASGDVSAQVRYLWGLPRGMPVETVALLAGTNYGQDVLDVLPYLAHPARAVVDKTALTDAQFQAERQTYADFDTLYRQAEAAGFRSPGGTRLTLSDGSLVTQTILIDGKALILLRRTGTQVLAQYFDSSIYAIQSTTGGMTRSLELGTNVYWGDWQPVSTGAAVKVETGAKLDKTSCLKNCLMKTLGGAAIGKFHKVIELAMAAPGCSRGLKGNKTELGICILQIQEAIPGAGDAVQLFQCFPDCGDPKTRDKWTCTESLQICSRGSSWWRPTSWYGGWKKEYAVYECQDGVWRDVPEYKRCSLPGEACVEGLKGADGSPCQGCEFPGTGAVTVSGADSLCELLSAQGGTCSSRRSTIQVAKDPNAKYGPSGNLVPGQWVTYTITYENEGAGQAFGVYITDTVRPQFDPATVMVYGAGSFFSETRTIFWEVGDLAPKGQTGSTGVVSFTAQLRNDLPGGTVIRNQAIVYFPSVPEETPTNPVVNVVQPLAAVPQSLQARPGQPLNITLEGVEVSGAALTYTVMTWPLGGSLTGATSGALRSSGAGGGGVHAAASGSALVYTPDASFSGPDSFTFKVSNGITESQAAEVQIVVSATVDTIPPQIRWTDPSSGKLLTGAMSPTGMDSDGQTYAPSLQIQFSEAVISSTLTSSSVRVVDWTGTTVSTTVAYDPTAHRALLVPRQAWRTGTHTATVTSAVTDEAGNRLQSDYAWSFQAQGETKKIFLPVVVNAFPAGW